MAGAFQTNAFQNDAFQVDAAGGTVISLDPASHAFTGRAIGTSTTARLTAAAMGFVARAITIGGAVIVELTTAALSMTARAVTVTYVSATSVGNWIMTRRRRR